jgi:hypothetical protein
MAVLKPRNRLVFFRVSEDEFQQFRGLCEKEGARSISDLARDAMHCMLMKSRKPVNGEAVALQVEMLDKLISEVSAQLQQLSELRGHQHSRLINEGNKAVEESPTETAEAS